MHGEVPIYLLSAILSIIIRFFHTIKEFHYYNHVLLVSTYYKIYSDPKPPYLNSQYLDIHPEGLLAARYIKKFYEK